MKWCFIVTIKNLSVEDSKETITRVFTRLADVESFIEDCKANEGKYSWEYKTFRAELDGDPKSGFFGAHEAINV